MRDTVWSIILTQAPIAMGCLWVAWEIRGIRRAMEHISRTLADLRREHAAKDPRGDGSP